MKQFIYLSLTSILFLFTLQITCIAEIYKYKDENGVWRFTDTPPKYSDDIELLSGTESPEGYTGIRNLKDELFKKYKPKNAIQKASIGTVTIKSTLGLGSGFFITEKGHIITNRHVLRGDEAQQKYTKKYINNVDNAISKADEKYHQKGQILSRVKQQLDTQRKAILAEKDLIAKKRAEEVYQEKLAEYNNRKKLFEEERRQYKSKKSNYRKGKNQYNLKIAFADMSKTFEIILKDKTVLKAHLLSISDKYDLALLKLHKCITPALETADLTTINQGTRVYALGSPAGMRDTMTSGIISGFTDKHIKTNAKIYPGNSGGPLITKKGKVVGINTMKEITYKYEGLGLAIPIDVAMSEFAGKLN